VQPTDRESSPAEEGRDISVVYVCELPEVKGRFDIEKARKFFNRAGPHYGLLQAGKSVMSHDGVTMVRFQHEIVVIINVFRVRVMSV
jgi:ribonuclease Z